MGEGHFEARVDEAQRRQVVKWSRQSVLFNYLAGKKAERKRQISLPSFKDGPRSTKRPAPALTTSVVPSPETPTVAFIQSIVSIGYRGSADQQVIWWFKSVGVAWLWF